MSHISVSNILPSRTRSGRAQSKVEVTPPNWSPTWNPVFNPEWNKKKVKKDENHALEVLWRTAIYVGLRDEANELYHTQVQYVQKK